MRPHIERTRILAKIGIWWDGGGRIAALAHPCDENATQIAGRIDSNLAHADEWPQVARRFGLSAHDEYFVVPRGRVLIDARTGNGIILHGNATDQERLSQIAEQFELSEWRAEFDAHYSTGAAVDHLFDAEEEY